MSGSFSFKGNLPDDRDLSDKRINSELKKTRKMIKALHKPALPVYCRFFFWCMLVATAMDLIMELVSYIRTAQFQPFGMFLMKASWSMLIVWSFFAVFLAVFSGIQYYKAVKYGYEDRIFRFKDEILKTENFSDYEVAVTPEEGTFDRERLILYSKKACPDTKKKYLRYLVIALGGIAVLIVFYILCRLLIK